MMLSKIEPLLSLSNAAEEDGVRVALQPLLCLVEERERRLDISVLA